MNANISFQVCNWGQEGQMQIDLNRLLVTACMDGLKTRGNEEYAMWISFEVESENELEQLIDQLKEMRFYVVL